MGIRFSYLYLFYHHALIILSYLHTTLVLIHIHTVHAFIYYVSYLFITLVLINTFTSYFLTLPYFYKLEANKVVNVAYGLKFPILSINSMYKKPNTKEASHQHQGTQNHMKIHLKANKPSIMLI